MVPLLLIAVGVGVAVAVTYWDEIREWVIAKAYQVLGRFWHASIRWVYVVLDQIISPLRQLFRRVRRRVFAQTATQVAPAQVFMEEIPVEDLPSDVRAQLCRAPIVHTYQV